MIQDTLTVVASMADTATTAVDSLAAVVGSGVGAQVTAWTTLLLSAVTTLAVSFAKRVLTHLNSASPSVKAITATVFAQVATWVGTQTGLVVNTDISALETTVAGLVVALGAMGAHAVSKVARKSLQ